MLDVPFGVFPLIPDLLYSYMSETHSFPLPPVVMVKAMHPV